MKAVGKDRKIKWKYILLVVITSLIISIDQLTKFLITEKFRLGDTLVIIPEFFNITYVQNKGAAFGMFSQTSPSFRVPFFIFVPLIALLSIGSIYLKLPDQDVKFSTALSLVIAGAIGNLLDRFMLGYVVDFLDFHWGWQYHFPAFNVADSAICVGVGLLILDLFTQKRMAAKKRRAR